MGLEKTKMLDSGVEVDYWRIYKLDLSFDAGVAFARMAGYMSQSERDGGKKPVDYVTNINLGAELFDSVFRGDDTTEAIIIGQAYLALRALSDIEAEKDDTDPTVDIDYRLRWFSGAVDVLE